MNRRALGIFVVIALLVLLARPAPVNPADTACVPPPVIKVFMAHSYDPHHPSTRQLVSGANAVFAGCGTRYTVVVKGAYMDDIGFGGSETQRKAVAQDILRRISEFKPDFVMTTDDTAFTYIGLAAAEAGYRVAFSGVSRAAKDMPQISEAAAGRLVGLGESSSLEPLARLLKDARIFPNAVYVYADESEASFYEATHVLAELQAKLGIRGTMVQLRTVSQLRMALRAANARPQGVLYTTLQGLEDDDTRRQVPASELVKEFLQYNKTHLEVANNVAYSGMGLSLSLAQDLFLAGSRVAEMIVETADGARFPPVVALEAPTRVAMNVQRLRELRYELVYREGVRSAAHVFDTY